jgi:glycosyltransferase involved in cell wall biosynthesis
MLPSDRLTLLGHRTDMAALLPGLDVLALPSAWGEGFPNIVGEAMASGVPCVATDVGDSGWIIGDTGFTVPPRDPGAMAQALLSLARMGADARASLGAAARARIEKHFPLSRVAADYADVCRDVMATRRRAETTLLDDAARAT